MAPHSHGDVTRPLLEDGEGHSSDGCKPPGQPALAKRSDCTLLKSCFLSDGKTRVSKGQTSVQRKLLIACILCFMFMIVEAVGGYLAHSVAVMSDAAHMFSDVAGMGVSLFAAHIAVKRSYAAYSFGYHRAEILGALLSIMLIWAVTGALVWEAIQRLIAPHEVDGKIMFIVASVGIVFNLVVALVLGHSHGFFGHGCSHDHDDHDHHGDHDHEHEHGHSHGHQCSHGHGNHAGHNHEHGHGGCSSSHSRPEGAHTHSHGHGHGSCSHAHQGPSTACGHSHGASPAGGTTPRGGSPNVPSHKRHHPRSSSDGVSFAEAKAATSDAQEQSSQAAGGPTAAASAAVGGPGRTSADSHGSSSHGHAHGEEHKHEGQWHDHGHGHAHTHGDSPCDPASGHGLARVSPGRHGGTAAAVAGSAPPAAAAAAAAVAAGKSRAGRTPVSPHARGGGTGCGHSHGPTGHGHGHSHGHDHAHGNMNLRSALLHVIGDLVQSMGVALSGFLIWTFQDDPRWQIADPICTFIFAILVVMTTVHIIRDIMHTLMERAPLSIDIEDVSNDMEQIEGVHDVHDLHIWSLSSGITILTAHVHITLDAVPDRVLCRLEAFVQSLGIHHSTIQICNPVGVVVTGPVDAPGLPALPTSHRGWGSEDAV